MLAEREVVRRLVDRELFKFGLGPCRKPVCVVGCPRKACDCLPFIGHLPTQVAYVRLRALTGSLALWTSIPSMQSVEVAQKLDERSTAPPLHEDVVLLEGTGCGIFFVRAHPISPELLY